MRLLRRALCLSALVVVVPGVGAFENFPISYNSLGVEGSYVDSGNSRNKGVKEDNFSNYGEYGVNFTRQFEPRFSMFLQATYAEPETRLTNLDGELWRLSAGGRVHPLKFRLSGWRPFGGLGYSYTDIDIEAPFGPKDENALYIEGGMQRMVSPRFLVEAGVRARTELEDGYVDGQYFAGVHYLFGREYPRAPDPQVRIDKTRPVAVAPPKDSDGDGVIDELDKCPDTPQGALVDSDGCPKELTKTIRETLYVEFELDRTEVRPQYFQEIGELAKILRQYPNSTILLEGHTDSTGSSSYNQQLSKSRADAVMKVLVERFEIDVDRITTSGMGESQPIASNKTAEGRAQNRRVEAIVSGKYSEIIKK
ncbi:OOP family OmpA-OmpF porin [Marinobacter pelagius]|uniref:OOP family OmpA-OmpF porin n=1 Tax=Marinobacter pelagius TaxID=379482 RepID=A0A366GE41_9GAMM|nr:OmpA family protein [Marinobacter pelagius]RBP25041.1 OOP family OmpA-OmpF porin [Marinobacter pelagius]